MGATITTPAPAIESLFGVPFSGSPLMRPEAAADAFGFRDRSTIYVMIETGELEAHRKPSVKKAHFRITRRSVLARLAANATKPLPELPTLMFHLAGTLSARQRAKFVAELERMAGR